MVPMELFMLYQFCVTNNIKFLNILLFALLVIFVLYIFYKYKIIINYVNKDHIITSIIENQKKNGIYFVKNSTNDPLGLVISCNYVCYNYTECNTQGTSKIYSYILTTDNIYSSLYQNKSEKTSATYYTITGCSYWDQNVEEYIYYEDEFKSSKNQKKIINEIIIKYNKKPICKTSLVIFIYGLPRSGKSEIGNFLVKYYKSSICIDWNPTMVGFQFRLLYNKVKPTKDKPLIIMLNEIDISLLPIIDGTIEQIKPFKREVSNKTDFNNLLDTFKNKYNNVIVIMTSNIPSGSISDQSLLRNGRVDIKYTLIDDI